MSIVFFLIVLSVLVLIHEAGHYMAARLFKVKADEFGYGFPPRLVGFVKEHGRWKRVGSRDRDVYPGTIWSINWLPLGGFVRIKGEQPGDEGGPDSFHAKPIWQRAIILAAGVGMNWVLAFVLFSLVFALGTNAVIDGLPPSAIIQNRAVRITQVLSGSPAETAGLRSNDAILSIEGAAPTDFEQARRMIAEQGEKTFPLTIHRDGQEMSLSVTPRYIPEAERIAIGVGLADVGRVSFPPLGAIKAGALATYGYTEAILITFGEILRDLFTRRPVSQDLSGPVGIAVLTGQIAQQGIVPLLQFSAILSINLAVINFLPIPALDGGRVLFLLIEKIRRRPISRRLEASVHNVAFVILLSLILLITVRDVSKYGGVILNGLKGAVGM